MPRLRQVGRDDAHPFALTMYDLLFGDRDPVAEPGTASGTPGDWWTVMALVPDVFDHAVAGLELYRSPERRLAPSLRELGQIRAGYNVGSRFVFSQHAKACRDVGISDDQVNAIPGWSAADCWSDAEKAVLAYTDALTLDHGRVSDVVFDALQAHLDDEQILELTYITLTYALHAAMCRALRLELDDGAEHVVELPDPDGNRAGLRVFDHQRDRR